MSSQAGYYVAYMTSTLTVRQAPFSKHCSMVRRDGCGRAFRLVACTHQESCCGQHITPQSTIWSDCRRVSTQSCADLQQLGLVINIEYKIKGNVRLDECCIQMKPLNHLCHCVLNLKLWTFLPTLTSSKTWTLWRHAHQIVGSRQWSSATLTRPW